MLCCGCLPRLFPFPIRCFGEPLGASLAVLAWVGLAWLQRHGTTGSLGKAHAMCGRMWSLWLSHVRSHEQGGAALFFLFLSDECLLTARRTGSDVGGQGH